ncbi:cysteine proteinase [Gymnopus androsaceus JB14]|uniref:Cysteine proteinase n=1 Tax=Gymnopus androsaceus JB14 TaxID=1447944 RepID=A0A6A4GG48_9AGAR|nr:cysteine proteinase [Gymnopus androsaceus JB14]
MSEMPEAIIAQEFDSLPNQDDPQVYHSFQLYVKQLCRIADFFHIIKKNIRLCITHHETPPLDGTILMIVLNLQHVWKYTLELKANTECTLFQTLDLHPTETVEILRSIMTPMSKTFEVKLHHISPASFKTLGVGQWLDNEIINYFVEKWCLKSQSTLGFNTWFMEMLCAHVKIQNGVLTLEDSKTVQRWCYSAEKSQGLVKWDRVFIPINEFNTHWYSASINFVTKRIEIYDSLAVVYFANRRRPVESRKNTNLMLVLMWLSEVLGRIRGEEVQLMNDSATEWQCDPHVEVPFQPNCFDCGVHVLWHLQHVLQFGTVQNDCVSPRWKFSSDMIGKRLRLAQEILDDCSL